jgi:phosphatidylinositol alpha-1,6-mannosyltransferase
MFYDDRTLILVMHLHLAPVALPLVSRGARLAIFIHGVEAWNRLSPLRGAAVRRAWRLISNSNYTTSRFIGANANLDIPPMQVCHLGISMQPPKPAPMNDAALFALVVGRMVAEERYKGHDLLIDHWSRVISEFPFASLVIAGKGDDRPRLQAKAIELGLGERVKFLGEVSDEVLSGLYRDCALFVMPSRNEGFGLVFLEAMRAGKACIGAAGAASEVISDGVTGMIVDPANPDQVLQAILRLFRSPELRNRMGRAGAERFASHFTNEQFQGRIRASLFLGADQSPARCMVASHPIGS